MFKKILLRSLSLLMTMALLFSVSACGESKENNTDTSSANSGDVNSSNTENTENTEKEDDSMPKFTITVNKNDPTKFENQRPYDKNKEDIAIVLVIGQSNNTTSVGYSDEFRGVVAGTDQAISDVPMRPSQGTVYSGNTVTSLSDANDAYFLCDPANEGNTLGGFCPAFGTALNQSTGAKVVFVHAAVGAVGMHEWAPDPHALTCTCKNNGKFSLYSNAITRYNDTYEALSKDYNVVLTGYVWNQGEHEEVYAKPGNTVCDAPSYYATYKYMHETIMDDLKLDFGSIWVVRTDKATVSSIKDTARESMSLTSIARVAQYNLCNDIDNLYMISRISETCDISMMTKYNGGGIHYNQATQNTIGIDCVQNLASNLKINDESNEFAGIEVYNKYGEKILDFDAEGKATDGVTTIKRNNNNMSLLARVTALGRNDNISVSCVFNDTEYYHADTMVFDINQLLAAAELDEIEVECIIK